MIKSFYHRFLIKLFQKSYGASLYIKLASTLYAIPPRLEHQAEVVTSLRDSLQGVLNSSIIPFHLSRIWPYWVYQQLNPKSPYFSYSGLATLCLNTTYRNWTVLSAPGVNEQAFIDPKGLITPIPKGWSLDTWIGIDGKRYSPSQLQHVTQEFESMPPKIHTKWCVKDIDVRTTTWFKCDTHQQGYVFYHVVIKNEGDAIQNASIYLAVRPYNPDGISPIREITYFNQQAFIIDNRVGVVLDQAPQHVVCSAFSDGDTSLETAKFDKVLHTICDHSMASAYAEYRCVLAPGQSHVVTCKIPTTPINPVLKPFQKALSVLDRDRLIQKIRGTQGLSWEGYEEQHQQEWTSIKQCLGELRIPDRHLQEVFQKNQIHLHSFVGKDQLYNKAFNFQPAKINEKIYLILALNRMGSASISQAFLRKSPYLHEQWIQAPRVKADEAGQLLMALYDTYRYTQDREFLEDHRIQIDRFVKAIRSFVSKWAPKSTFNNHMSRMFSGFTSSEEYMVTYFWAVSGLKVATEMADVLDLEEKRVQYQALYQDLLDSLQILLLLGHGRLAHSQFIPVSTKRLVDSGLVMSLVGVYPLGILTHEDERIVQTLRLLEQFLVDDILFNSIGYPGYHVFQNCQLAQVYILKKDPRAFTILEWITNSATPTCAWPESIHPLSTGGSGGDGHSGLACGEFLHLVRNMLVREDSQGLSLCPFIPQKWIEGEGLHMVDWPTPFGRFTMHIRSINDTVMMEWDPCFKALPDAYVMTVRLPFSIKEGQSEAFVLPNTYHQYEFQRQMA